MTALRQVPEQHHIAIWIFRFLKFCRNFNFHKKHIGFLRDHAVEANPFYFIFSAFTVYLYLTCWTKKNRAIQQKRKNAHYTNKTEKIANTIDKRWKTISILRLLIELQIFCIPYSTRKKRFKKKNSIRSILFFSSPTWKFCSISKF